MVPNHPPEQAVYCKGLIRRVTKVKIPSEIKPPLVLLDIYSTLMHIVQIFSNFQVTLTKIAYKRLRPLTLHFQVTNWQKKILHCANYSSVFFYSFFRKKNRRRSYIIMPRATTHTHLPRGHP